MGVLCPDGRVFSPLLLLGKYVSKYAECGFKTVWFASAFKGTTGPAQAWTPLNHHLQNHLQWLGVMRSVAKTSSARLQGIVLTGWQRQGPVSGSGRERVLGRGLEIHHSHLVGTTEEGRESLGSDPFWE